MIRIRQKGVCALEHGEIRGQAEKALDIHTLLERRAWMAESQPGQEIVLRSKRDTPHSCNHLLLSLALSCIFTVSMFLSTAFVSTSQPISFFISAHFVFSLFFSL